MELNSNTTTPLKRFINLLKMDKKDIYQVFFYAIFSGIVSLSLPLGVQAIINLIQGGRVSLSWIILVTVVLLGIIFNGILRLMQLRITESIQQKIFIRSSFEFTFRFPKIKYTEFNNNYPPELANRFFDTITVQKSVAKLILDYSESLLQIVFGLLLLSIYHPLFILFGLLLFIVLYLIFRISFENGLKTSLTESKYKYKVAHWIQEIARNYFGFKSKIESEFALSKNDKLVTEYLKSRESHFEVIKRQFIQLIGFKALISAGLLLIGGYLVIQQQLNIGQFVAAEIIILLVINSVEKIIVGLETFYDVLTSIEKIGQVVDMEIEEEDNSESTYCYKNIQFEIDQLNFAFPDSNKKILNSISLNIKQGEKIYLDGKNGSGKTTLLRILAGLIHSNGSSIYINDEHYNKINMEQYRSQIGIITEGQTLFEGTIAENITFKNPKIATEKLKLVLEKIKLTEIIKKMPKGLDEKILTEGKQLPSSLAQKIILARAIVNDPLVLFLENPFDKMDDDESKEIIDFILSNENNWTVIVTSKNNYWKEKCNRIITLDKGKLISDTK
ncbi:ATP-binding cassette domain-containing protein [Flavobacterium piscinae]|uniref:ATP-binding cassette domain-containing protein n=1 Tax=Flavobacterium piscinae TaxID=2506424 RepID=A0A4Q1KJW5_9FLAO|nr:ATP-binding cassette domain-containing protein [Flavobacterium piscinae]RXR29685.1 ATP-binding cassette domain-containing protein [Flavobacterium piscinae]